MSSLFTILKVFKRVMICLLKILQITWEKKNSHPRRLKFCMHNKYVSQNSRTYAERIESVGRLLPGTSFNCIYTVLS